MNEQSKIETIAAQVNADDNLVRRGRYVDTTFLLAVENDDYLISVRHGRIANVRSGPFVTPDYTFALRAPLAVWQKFWQPLPPVGFNDIFALVKQKLMHIEGDLHPLMANLLYFKDVLAMPRKGGAR